MLDCPLLTSFRPISLLLTYKESRRYVVMLSATAKVTEKPFAKMFRLTASREVASKEMLPTKIRDSYLMYRTALGVGVGFAVVGMLGGRDVLDGRNGLVLAITAAGETDGALVGDSVGSAEG